MSTAITPAQTITSREYPAETIKTEDMINLAMDGADLSKTEIEKYAPWNKKDSDGNLVFSGETTTYYDKSGYQTGSVSRVPHKDINNFKSDIDKSECSIYVTVGNEQYIDWDGDGEVDAIDKKVDIYDSDEYKEWREEYESALKDWNAIKETRPKIITQDCRDLAEDTSEK